MTKLDIFDMYRKGRYNEIEKLVADPGYNTFLWGLRGWGKLARGQDGWADVAMTRYPLESEWAGQDLHGKVVMIKRQEGAGDQILYARFIPYLIAWAKEVWMCPAQMEGLERLFRESFPKLRWGVPEKIDYEIGSAIPRWTKPVDTPYLYRNMPILPRSLRPPDGRLRVGLTWQGYSEYPFNRERSLVWEDFHSLLQCDADFFTLQFEHSRPTGIPDLAADCKDFADTARALQGLDLLITTCTAMPNLAGALGYPKTWLILRDPIDFRWGFPAERQDWYPGIRQFRNVSMDVIKEALEQLIASRTCELTSVGSF